MSSWRTMLAVIVAGIVADGHWNRFAITREVGKDLTTVVRLAGLEAERALRVLFRV